MTSQTTTNLPFEVIYWLYLGLMNRDTELFQ